MSTENSKPAGEAQAPESAARPSKASPWRNIIIVFFILSALYNLGRYVLGADEKPQPQQRGFHLTKLRAALKKTKYAKANEDRSKPATPPASLFELVTYPTVLGRNHAYVTPVRPIVSGPKRPAIVWMHGGLTFGIGPLAWKKSPRSNDQSAAALREAGIVLMLPSLRGSHDNPGQNECFLGEVDDIIAAGKYLATRQDVDPDRVYLGGHSSGGTLALLAAASTKHFRAVFAFGPALSVANYDACLPRDADEAELTPRSPAAFLWDIRAPTFIIEGAEGNTRPYDAPWVKKGNAPVSILMVPGADHFTVLRPGSEVVAAAILEDQALPPNLSISIEAIRARLTIR